jgi:hypothetical protein
MGAIVKAKEQIEYPTTRTVYLIRRSRQPSVSHTDCPSCHVFLISLDHPVDASKTSLLSALLASFGIVTFTEIGRTRCAIFCLYLVLKGIESAYPSSVSSTIWTSDGPKWLFRNAAGGAQNDSGWPTDFASVRPSPPCRSKVIWQGFDPAEFHPAT